MNKRCNKSLNRAGSFIHDQRGIAMTEVVIAFLLLTIIFGILFHCVRFASNMMAKAHSIDDQDAELEENGARTFIRTAGDPDPFARSDGDVKNVGPVQVTFDVKGEKTLTFEVVKVNGSTEGATGSHSMKVKPAEAAIPINSDEGKERAVFFYSTAD